MGVLKKEEQGKGKTGQVFRLAKNKEVFARGRKVKQKEEGTSQKREIHVLLLTHDKYQGDQKKAGGDVIIRVAKGGKQ